MSWVCCNSCFQSPGPDRQLAVTTCGHVICSLCFQKGKQGECIICKAKCQVSPLSDKSSAEVKAMFSDINVVAAKHFAEIGKVITFQARHQKKLLAHYQQRNEKLEEICVKMKQEMQQMAMKLKEQSAYITKLENLQHQSAKASSASQMSHSSHIHGSSVQQIPFNSPISLSRQSSTTNVDEWMDVDGRSLFRKPDPVPRLSLISPPQDGRMGTIPQRSISQPSTSQPSTSQPSTPQRSTSQRSTPQRSTSQRSTFQPSTPQRSTSQRSTFQPSTPQRSTIQNALANHSTHSATVSRFPGSPVTPNISYGVSSGWRSPILTPPPSCRYSSTFSLKR